MQKAKILARYGSSGTPPPSMPKVHYSHGADSAPPQQLYARNSPKIISKTVQSVDTTRRVSLPDVSIPLYPLSPTPIRPKTACMGDLEDLMKTVTINVAAPALQDKKAKTLSALEQLEEDKKRAYRRMYLHGLKIDSDSYRDPRIRNYLQQRGIGMEVIETGSPVIVNCYTAHKDRFRVNPIALSYEISEGHVRSFMEQRAQEDRSRCGLKY